MTFGFGFGLPSYAARAAAGGPSLDAQVLALFAAGEQGCWYDPSDMSTLFQDTAGIVPVTAVGQQVARINDKSGRGNFAIQATAASRPLLQQDGSGKWYLAFDGSNDFLSTGAINFTTTGSMTWFIGIVKNSDAVAGVVIESSVASATNPGTFYLAGPFAAATPNFALRSAGTILSTGIASSSFPAPTPYVLTGQLAIATDQLTMRANGASAPLTGAADQGTGNYGNYPMFIGARSGGTPAFNGRIYGLIIRGAASDASQVTSGEAWTNSKTGAF